MMGISACCLIFTGWAISEIQHRKASEPPHIEKVADKMGVLV